MQKPSDREYKLDFNHSPDLFRSKEALTRRLRSGDSQSIEALAALDNFFAAALGYKHAGFLDFSPLSIAALLSQIIGENGSLAYSSKLSYFLDGAVSLLKAQGVETLCVPADIDGSLNKESLEKLSKDKNRYLLCAVVDEDTFFIENMEETTALFPKERIIADISNAAKKIEPDKYRAALIWGYKLGSLKRSGVYATDEICAASLDSIDLAAYSHLQEAFCAYEYNDDPAVKKSFIEALQKTVKEGFSAFVDPVKTLNNAVYCRFEGIKARDFIRALALENIFTTNGELCSLALSKPSKILQSLGYKEDEAREGLSVSFEPSVTANEAEYLGSRIGFRYLQIRAILG